MAPKKKGNTAKGEDDANAPFFLSNHRHPFALGRNGWRFRQQSQAPPGICMMCECAVLLEREYYRCTSGCILDCCGVCASRRREADQHDVALRRQIQLLDSCISGEVAAVSEALAEGASVAKMGSLPPPLLAAAEFGGGSEIIAMLLAHGARLEDTSEEDGATALILAAEAGNFAAVSLLVEHNANIEAADAEGWQALHAAIAGSSTQAVRLFLRSGASLNRTATDYNWTPLMLAAIFGEEEIAGVLLEAGDGKSSNNDARDARGRTAVILCAAGLPRPIRRKNLTHKNAVPVQAATPTSGLTTHARRLLAAQNASASEDTLPTPSKDRVAVLNRLVEAECDLNAADGDKHTAVMYATMNDDALILETLISAKADILHNVNSRKMTADLMALEARKVNALNVLLESGAQLDLGELLMFDLHALGHIDSDQISEIAEADPEESSSERLPTPESSVKANGSPRRGSGPHSTAAAGTAIRSLPFKTRDVEQEARRKLAFLVYDSEYKTKRGPGSLLTLVSEMNPKSVACAVFLNTRDDESRICRALRLSYGAEMEGHDVRKTNAARYTQLKELSELLERLASAICTQQYTEEIQTAMIDELLTGEVVTDIDEAAELKRRYFMQHPAVQNILDHVWYSGGDASNNAEMLGGQWYWHLVSGLFYLLTLPYFVVLAPGRLKEVNRPKQRFWVYQAQYTALLVSILNLTAIEDADPNDGSVLDICVLVWLVGKLLSEVDEALKVRLRHKFSWWETVYEHVFADFWNTMDMLAICIAIFAVGYRIGQIGNQEPEADKLYRIEHAIRGASSLLLWLRFTKIFSVISSTGPLLLMVFRMIQKDIGRYLLLQTLLVVAFASFFTSIYSNDSTLAGQQFSSMRKSLKTLVEMTLMIGDPADGPLWTNVATSTEPNLGWFVLALFALLSILLLVNLLIAMFGRTFEEISDDIDRQYMFVRAEAVLGARDLSVIPPPLNIVHWVLVRLPNMLVSFVCGTRPPKNVVAAETVEAAPVSQQPRRMSASKRTFTVGGTASDVPLKAKAKKMEDIWENIMRLTTGENQVLEQLGDIRKVVDTIEMAVEQLDNKKLGGRGAAAAAVVVVPVVKADSVSPGHLPMRHSLSGVAMADQGRGGSVADAHRDDEAHTMASNASVGERLHDMAPDGTGGVTGMTLGAIKTRGSAAGGRVDNTPRAGVMTPSTARTLERSNTMGANGLSAAAMSDLLLPDPVIRWLCAYGACPPSSFRRSGRRDFAMDNELRSEFLSGYKVAQILMSLPDASELDVPFDKFSESHAPATRISNWKLLEKPLAKHAIHLDKEKFALIVAGDTSVLRNVIMDICYRSGIGRVELVPAGDDYYPGKPTSDAPPAAGAAGDVALPEGMTTETEAVAQRVAANDSAEDALWGWLMYYVDDDHQQKIMLVLRFFLTSYAAVMASLLSVFVAQKCVATEEIDYEHMCTFDENFTDLTPYNKGVLACNFFTLALVIVAQLVFGHRDNWMIERFDNDDTQDAANLKDELRLYPAIKKRLDRLNLANYWMSIVLTFVFVGNFVVSAILVLYYYYYGRNTVLGLLSNTFLLMPKLFNYNRLLYRATREEVPVSLFQVKANTPNTIDAGHKFEAGKFFKLD